MKLREEIMNSEFTKYHIEGLPFDAVLHKFSPLDLAPNPHDHPFPFRSFILKGSYVERVYELLPDGKYVSIVRHRKQGSTHRVYANTIHEILEYPEGECWTMILPEPWERESLDWKFEDGRAYYKSWRETEYKLYENQGNQ